MTDARINEMLADLDALRDRLKTYRDEIVHDEIYESRETNAFHAIEAAGKLISAEVVVTDAAITLQVAYTASYRMSWQREEGGVR